LKYRGEGLGPKGKDFALPIAANTEGTTLLIEGAGVLGDFLAIVTDTKALRVL